MQKPFRVSAGISENLTVNSGASRTALLILVSLSLCLLTAMAGAEQHSSDTAQSGISVPTGSPVDTATQITQAVQVALWQRIGQDYPDVPDEQITTQIQVNDAAGSLPACPAPLLVDWRGGSLSNRITPRVSCDELGWQIYLPISLTIEVPVVVSSRSLSRGQQLTSADLSLALTDLATLRHGHYASIATVTGYELARNLAPGTVITPVIARPPIMIKRGDRVIIVASGSGLAVQTEGEALRDGAAGSQIPVRNLTSRQTVHAYVKSRGVVEIPVN
jgi:flagella basal body P-ring formation protein FlgA